MIIGLGIGITFRKNSIAAAFGTWSPSKLFASGEQGAWYDPSDLTLGNMYQESTKATPVTAVEQQVGWIQDKSGRGNHASQSTSISRPTLSARVNALTNTEALATQTINTTQFVGLGVSASWRLAFSGTGTVTIGGTAYPAGVNTLTIVSTASLSVSVSGTVTKADLRPANDGVGLPAYQRVGNVSVTPSDYDTVGFPKYLRFDGIDDYLQTNSINFTSTDKMTVWAGVRKLSDAAQFPVVAELSNGLNAGTFSLYANGNGSNLNGYCTSLRGSAGDAYYYLKTFSSPITSVLSNAFDIGGATITEENKPRVNGTVPTLVVGGSGPAGAGNFNNYPLYIGRRGGTTLPLNGRLYSLIVRGAQSTADEISKAEAYVNNLTKAYA